jgi:FKBP-type peptidyl-prolyl cis-trans isomerase (trigger factor)
MLANVQTTSNKRDEENKVAVTVTLTADEVQKEIDAAYKAAGKNRIPGFRAGKAPRKILENHFGGKEYFRAEATDELVKTFSPLATDELNIVALSRPEFEEVELAEEGSDYTYSFVIEVTPEFELSSYDPVQIELPSAEPTEEELQTQIDLMLQYYVTADEEGNEQLPELTDAWVKETLEFESVDEFKERLAESIRDQKGQDLPSLREYLSSQEIAKRLVGEVPESMVRQTEQDNYRDLFQMLQAQHLTLDSYIQSRGLTSETLRDSMHQQAHDSAAIALALDALGRHLKLVGSDEEIREEFAKSGADKPDELYENWRNNGRLSEVRQGLVRMKAAQHIADTVEIFGLGELWPAADAEGAEEAATDAAEGEAAADAKPKKAKKAKKAAEADKVSEPEPAEPKKPKKAKKPAEPDATASQEQTDTETTTPSDS